MISYYMDNTKDKVKAELALGATPKELAHKYKVPYSTVISWRNKLKEEQGASKDIDVLVKTDETTLKHLASEVKKNAPSKVKKQIDDIVEGVVGLQELEPKFHSLVFNLLAKAEQLAADDDLSVRDWATLSTGIGQLYASIFNKNAMSVNVLNQTNVSSEKLSMFKGSMKS